MSPRSVLYAVTAWLLIGPRALWARGEVSTTLSAPVGYDSNALLEVNPVGMNAGARGSFVGAEGTLTLRLRGQAWEAFVGYDGDYRSSSGFGSLLWHSLEAGTAWQGRTTRLELAWLGVQLVAPDYAQDEWLGTGPRTSASLALTPRMRLRVEAGTQLRRTDRNTQGYSHVSLSAPYLVGTTFTFGLGSQSAWLGQAPFATSPAWQRHRLMAFASLATKPWAVWAGPFVGLRNTNSAYAGQFGALVGIERAFGWGIGLKASLDVTAEWGAAEAGRADRTEGTFAVVWRGAAASKQPLRNDDDDLTPAVQPRGVRFRLRAPHAQVVRLIGSFDGWGDGLLMQRVPRQSGLWQVWLTQPPCGPLRYRFLIDDVPATPANAPRYVADGFGGRDGEIEIPEPRCFKKETIKGVSSQSAGSF